MGRAYGKKTPRGVLDELAALAGLDGGAVDELTGGEKREAGIGDPRDIPGGRPHLANPPVPRFKVPSKPAQDPFRKLNAHGVDPHDAGYVERDPRLAGAVNTKARPRLEAEGSRPSPVPVYLVEESGGPEKVRMAAPRSITCPASTSAEPARVCGLNPRRVRIGLLNEDTATDIRLATGLSELAAGTGALVPWPSNTYLWFETQGELFAIGATGAGTPRLSIIEVTQESAAV